MERIRDLWTFSLKHIIFFKTPLGPEIYVEQELEWLKELQEMDDTTETVSFRHKRIDRHMKRDCGSIHRSFSNLKWGMRWESRHYLQFSTKMLFQFIAINKGVAFLEGHNISNKSYFAEDPVTSNRQPKQINKKSNTKVFLEIVCFILLWFDQAFSFLVLSSLFLSLTLHACCF